MTVDCQRTWDCDSLTRASWDWHIFENRGTMDRPTPLPIPNAAPQLQYALARHF